MILEIVPHPKIEVRLVKSTSFCNIPKYPPAEQAGIRNHIHVETDF